MKALLTTAFLIAITLTTAQTNTRMYDIIAHVNFGYTTENVRIRGIVAPVVKLK